MQGKITKWQSNRDKLKKLLEQMQTDKTGILEKLVELGVKSENDLANNPKGQILHDELKDIVKQMSLYDKKYQDYDLAIFKSESRVRTVARQLAAKEAGVSDAELEELTRSMVTLDESLSSEKEAAVPIDLKDTLKDELAHFHQRQQASSSGKIPAKNDDLPPAVGTPRSPEKPQPVIGKPDIQGSSDWRAFVGQWDCGKGDTITLNADFTASKDTPNLLGKWECVNGEAHIAWDGGARTVLRRNGEGFQKLTWHAGVSLDSPPLRKCIATITFPV